MAWKVRLNDRARKELKKLDPQVAKRVFKFFHDRIEGKENPRSVGSALEGSQLGEFWKYRIGDWRAICSIQDGTITVFVLSIQHRRLIYNESSEPK